MPNLALLHLVLLLLSILKEIQCRDFKVRHAADLRSALEQVQPGDVINLIRESDLPKLELEGLFEITRNGTASAPIHFNGHPNITFIPEDGAQDGTEDGIALFASYWILNGLVISGAPHTANLHIRGGHFNKISNLELKNSYFGIGLTFANYNEIVNISISDCIVGIWLQGSSDNLVQNCQISQSIEASFSIDGSRRNIIRNNWAGIKEHGSSHLYIGYFGNELNVIQGNSFDIDPDYKRYGSVPFYIRTDGMGVFEKNKVIDGSTDGGYLIFTQASNYTFANNVITTRNSTPFKLWKETSGVKFNGNQMRFLERNHPAPYCILGDPEFPSKNIEINDNICINGKLINIFEI